MLLYGMESPARWAFRVESTAVDLLEEEDDVELIERPWVVTWRAALKQLDMYPRTQLAPLSVHPDFRTRVMKALQTRQEKGVPVGWNQWSEALKIDIDF
ncbi:hypothetical protein ACFQNJ_01320 [Hydrogenophaga bisanensis]|uniref:Uncharacterized protein n=1 Tax=Hydrogenophaga bisanensis TaxID=439611 RepID=A0ABW2R416_9BURK